MPKRPIDSAEADAKRYAPTAGGHDAGRTEEKKAAGRTGAKPRNPGGRPAKFDEPSRPVTVTLPESTLELLSLIDPDRGKAIVKLARMAARRDEATSPPIEVVDMAQDAGVLVVGPSALLRQIPFLHLIEVAPARFLLALDSGYDFKALELALLDRISELRDDQESERSVADELLSYMRTIRQSESGKTAEILFVPKPGRKKPK